MTDLTPREIELKNEVIRLREALDAANKEIETLKLQSKSQAKPKSAVAGLSFTKIIPPGGG